MANKQLLSKRLKSSLTHVEEETGMPHMVDVSMKDKTTRTAVAQTTIFLPEPIATYLRNSSKNEKEELITSKGPVFSTAIVAGTMAVKQTSQLIPFCHPIALTGCAIDIDSNLFDDVAHESGEILVTCTVKTRDRTGVEMEALTGATITGLTIYDMLKALGHDITLTKTRVVSKDGGKRPYRLEDKEHE